MVQFGTVFASQLTRSLPENPERPVGEGSPSWAAWPAGRRLRHDA